MDQRLACASRDDRRRLLLGLVGGTLLQALPARALQAPGGRVELRVAGKVGKPNRGAEAVFDMAMLGALPQRTISAKVPWYPTPRRFTGPLLRDVLAAAGASGSSIRSEAVNDYHADAPFEDSQRFDVVVARLLDDKPMSVREKGLLAIMYPFADHPDIANAVYFDRCTWQLKVLRVS